MAGNRKQPFGYRMEFGEYTPHPAEAETVRWIYQTYLGRGILSGTGGGTPRAGNCL